MKLTTHKSLFSTAGKALLLAALTAGMGQAGETVYQTFDADGGGFYWESWSAAGSSLAFDSTQNAAVAGAGASGSLKLVCNFTAAAGYQQAVFSKGLSAPYLNMETNGAISLDIKVDPSSTPRAAGDYGAFEVILRQGSGWTWTALPWVRLNGTDWQRVTIPIPPDLNVGEIRAITLKLGENELAGPITLNIDNIAFTTTPDDVVITQANSLNSDGWSWESWSKTGLVTWDPLDFYGRSTSGSIKLDHQFDNAPGSYQQSVFTYVLPGGEVNAAKDYSTLNLDVKVDSTSVARAGGDYGYFEVILRNGSGWTWLSTTPVGGTGTGSRITDNEWHRISVKVPATADKVHRLTFKVGDSGFTGPVVLNVDNITWTRNTAPIDPPTLSIKKEEPGLSLVATSTDQYGRHNIYTAEGANGEYSFISSSGASSEPVSYSFTLDSFPDATTYPGFQAHIFLVPGAPGGGSTPDWNEPTLLFMDIKANAAGGGNAVLRKKVDQAGGNSQLYAAGAPTVASATILGTWTLTGQGSTFTMTAPDGTVSAPFDIGPEAAAAFGSADPSPLRVYFGIQPNGTANIGQAAKVGGLKIAKGATVLLEDKFNGDALDITKWVENATPGGVNFVSAADAGYVIGWTIPDTGFVLKMATNLTTPTWTDVAGTPLTVGSRKQVRVPKSELPAGAEAYFALIQPAP